MYDSRSFVCVCDWWGLDGGFVGFCFNCVMCWDWAVVVGLIFHVSTVDLMVV